MQLDYHVVDVFSAKPLEGNPVAVFTNAQELPAYAMQKVAGELRLSETVFLLPPTLGGCDVRARIFTPSYEMAFAGHPTLGAAYVVRDTFPAFARAYELILEELVGPVRVHFDQSANSIIWFESPTVSKGPSYSRSLCASLLGLLEEDLMPGLPCELLTAGNPNVFVPVRDANVVDRVTLDSARFAALHSDQDGPVCMFVFAPVAGGAYSRMFAPELGIAEDPATGSAAGPLATYMMEHSLVSRLDGTRFISEQGTKLGRRSLLHVLIQGESGLKGILVGGEVSPIVRATMTL